MKQILQFIGQNKYVLTIGFIAFIIQFEGLVYLISHKQSDFSYSGHEFEWCIFKFSNRKDLIWNL